MRLRSMTLRSLSRSFLSFLLIFVLFMSLIPFRNSLAADSKQKNPLWLVRSGQSSIYLMGSMHMLKKEAYPLQTALEQAYQASDILVLETDLGAADSPAFQAQVLQLGTYQDNTTLEQHISKDTFALVKSKAAGLGLPIEQISQFKPWTCALVFVQLEFMRLGFDPNLGVDRHFFEQARQDRKSLQWLESVDFQLQLLTQLGKENEEAFLKQTFRDLDLFKTKADQLYTNWRDGDTTALVGLMDEEFKGFPELYNRLFLTRNRDWLPKIEKLIEQKSKALIVVGYGHLIGPQGLVEMLRDKGYQVEQL